MTALLARRACAWWCSSRVQRLVWPSLVLNAAYTFLPPARRILPNPMLLADILGQGTWLLGN